MNPHTSSAFTPVVADDILEAILDAHGGLTPEQSQALNARLVLALAARIADADLVRACLADVQ
jgi:hypothetical protein